ncbi:MAG: 50S ribosomal protein L32e [DPANN group archaeon]|nr:50S ribosomal protein L32e [DPANN group archaeon]
MLNKRQKPTFKRQRSHAFKRVGRLNRWRRPRGMDSKQAKGMKHMGAKPNVGYGQPKTIRGLHPSGLLEAMVLNLNGIENLNPKEHIIRIGGSVGTKKRMQILEKAKELKIRVTNENIKERPKKKEKKKAKTEEAKPEATTDAATGEPKVETAEPKAAETAITKAPATAKPEQAEHPKKHGAPKQETQEKKQAAEKTQATEKTEKKTTDKKK